MSQLKTTTEGVSSAQRDRLQHIVNGFPLAEIVEKSPEADFQNSRPLPVWIVWFGFIVVYCILGLGCIGLGEWHRWSPPASCLSMARHGCQLRSGNTRCCVVPVSHPCVSCFRPGGGCWRLLAAGLQTMGGGALGSRLPFQHSSYSSCCRSPRHLTQKAGGKPWRVHLLYFSFQTVAFLIIYLFMKREN